VICCGGVSVYLLADRDAAFATVAQLQKLPQARARSEGQRLRRVRQSRIPHSAEDPVGDAGGHDGSECDLSSKAFIPDTLWSKVSFGQPTLPYHAVERSSGCRRHRFSRPDFFPTIFPIPEKAMLSKREQDTETTVHFRSDRVSRVNGMYFFSTRENTLEGPFFSKEDAERETEAYVRRMQAGRLSQPEPPSSLLNG
jgi:hypothetical protein